MTAAQVLKQNIQTLFRNPAGRFTEELKLAPGGFHLGRVPARLKPDAITSMICGFCSTGCSLDIHLKSGKAVNLTPSPNYPVNIGMACPKGWEALTPLRAPDRATRPLLRNQRGQLEPISWDLALRTFCERFKEIQHRHGPEAVAFLSTGQIVTEEMALLGALAKFGMGMVHGDGNTRQCMASAVVAYKQSFGFDAPPYTYKDFEESDVIILVGSNLCIAHPIMWGRILMNRRRPRIVVIDPRRTETAMAATDHYAIRPKSDLALFYGIAHILIREGWIHERYIEEHTTGFISFKTHVADYTPERVSAETGISADRLFDLARMIHEKERVSFWWTMGVNQSYEGVRTAQALINLALMTGHIGRPGTGANSITGQCNAMGSRLFSNTTNLLGGHDFQNPEHREKVAGILGIDAGRLPDRNSMPYNQIIEGIGSGKIRGIWMIATNGGHSWINQNAFRTLIGKLEFFVVQDMYHTTESAQLAHLLLPAAGWGEKEGTFINSERRIGLVKPVSTPPGEALTDFRIFQKVAEYWGCEEMFRGWKTPEDVFQLLKRLSRGQPCDITGIRDYGHLEASGGIQWPFPEGANETASERRLFEDGRFYHADGKARFIFGDPQKMPDDLNDQYPFMLLTGRGSASQWHTQTRTAKSPVLQALCPGHIYVEINPRDARTIGIHADEWVFVESRRGKVSAIAFLSHSVPPGSVFMPMHYEQTNHLTDSSFDPYSFQPSYKACAVRISKRD